MLNYGETLKRMGAFMRRSLKEKPSEVYILLDALDSGLSIDNIRDVRSVLDLILEDCKNVALYIIVAANSYEMIKGADCIAVSTGTHKKFTDYEAYAGFICK